MTEKKGLKKYVICWGKNERVVRKADRHEIKGKRLTLFVGERKVAQFPEATAWWIKCDD